MNKLQKGYNYYKKKNDIDIDILISIMVISLAVSNIILVVTLLSNNAY